MTYSNRFEPDPTNTELAALMGWADATSWGEMSFDQADGFAPADDSEPPSADFDDDRGYGFGV